MVPVLRSYPGIVAACLKSQSIYTEFWVVSGSPEMSGDNIIYSKPDMDKTKGRRVSEALNDFLAHVKVSDYDWLIKIDEDVAFDRDFIKTNIEEADRRDVKMFGRGSALFMEVASFMEATGGRLTPTSNDDRYLLCQFEVCGFSTIQWAWFYPPTVMRRMSMTPKEQWWSGFDTARMGKVFWWRYAYMYPLHLLGWFAGLVYPFKFPIHDAYINHTINKIRGNHRVED